MTVTAGGESHEVDARPSDALNLALRVGAPVFVTAEVIDQGGACRGLFASLLSEADGDERDDAGPQDEWQSLSPDLIR